MDDITRRTFFGRAASGLGVRPGPSICSSIPSSVVATRTADERAAMFHDTSLRVYRLPRV